ncbi:MAG: LUD domain-containing protein [Prolixibacteraceae bacterium]|nr:LUD domain-containing protein [Prolixibacteraceae bacterium]
MKSAREEILEKLKGSNHHVPDKPDFDSPVYHPIEKPLELAFKENLEKVNGHVYLFQSKMELYEVLNRFLSNVNKNRIFCFENKIAASLNNISFAALEFSNIPEDIEIGITGCEFLIAHTGSIMVSSAQKGGRQLFVYPPIHIIVAKQNQLVEYLENAYSRLFEKYATNLPSHIALITGPSRTADIEKTLVLGAHGPREIHVFIS